MQRRIILIGGAPTTGKSTIARQLATRLNLPLISTDQIRTIMRTATTPEVCPDLYLPKGHNAEKFLTHFTTTEIAAREVRQGEIVWAGIKALIDNTKYSWNDGFICEGVGILPHLAARDFEGDSTITALFLCDRDIDNARKVIFKRGLWDSADTYPDDVKEKEVAWVALYAKQLEAEVRTYAYPWICIEKTPADIETVLSVLAISSSAASEK